VSSSKPFPGERLVEWFDREARDLPWRRTDDPYRIWVSEIMLQQTQVNTVIDYYHRFLERFPDVEALAGAERDDVMKMWEGLGYYNRARWLHEAAGTVVEEHDGQIPRDNETRKELKGIGDYTAAAIGAFAFDQAHPVVDGNVARVVSRIKGIEEPVDRTDTERRIAHYVGEWLEAVDRPGTLSEALMELGALICTPSNPDCEKCPVSEHCTAREEGRQADLPVTGERPDRPHYEVAAGVIREGSDVLISRRPEDGMLAGLWEFPGGKQEEGESLSEALRRELHEELGIETVVGEKLHKIPHEYSHLTINLHVYACEIEQGKPQSREGQRWEWVSIDRLDDYAFPASNRPIVESLRDETPVGER
jgi:A/G-specific adenine glycosylase